MKMMVKLSVLITTLFLLAGVSFANGDCHDYEFTYTNLDDPEFSGTWCVELCFDAGTFTGFCDVDVNGNLVLFFDSMNKQALWYGPDTVGYLKFHGDRLFIFNGIELCGSTRYEIKGHQVDECIIFAEM